MASTWTSTDPRWTALTDSQKAAVMSLMEAGLSKPGDAMNAAGAMVNRSAMTGEPLGQHVSRSIYQPTIEPSQHSRLGQILESPQFGQMTDWVSHRQAGSIPDPVNGATHFLAKPGVMLALERQNPSKYHNWGPRGANWTGYDEATGKYSNQRFEDSSHAFLLPEEMGGSRTAQSTYRVASGPSEASPQPTGVGDMAVTAANKNGAFDKLSAALQGSPQQAAVEQQVQKAANVSGIELPDASLRKLSNALLAQGADTSRVRGPWEAAGSIAETAVGSWQRSEADKQEKAYNDRVTELLQSAASGGSTSAIAQAMLASKNPELQKAGLNMIVQSLGPKSAPTVHPGGTDEYGRKQPDLQWNASAGRWEPMIGGGQSPTQTTHSSATAPYSGSSPTTAYPTQQAPASQSQTKGPAGWSTSVEPSAGSAFVAAGAEPTSQTVQPAPIAPSVPTATAQQAPSELPSGYRIGAPVPKAPEGYVHQAAPGGGFLYGPNGQPVFESKAEADARARIGEKRSDDQREADKQVSGVSAVINDARKLTETPGFNDALRLGKVSLNVGVPSPWGTIGGDIMEVPKSVARWAAPQQAGWAANDELKAVQNRLSLIVGRPLMKGQGSVSDSERTMVSDAIGGLSKSGSPADYQFRLNSVQRMIEDMNTSGKLKPSAEYDVRPSVSEIAGLIDTNNNTFSTDGLMKLAEKYNVSPIDMQDYVSNLVKQGRR
jgi:hypothetical protein